MTAVSAKCDCGQVQIELDHAPDFINDCNCSLCTRSKAIWGYFNVSNVRVTGQTRAYTRPDRPAPIVEIHSCETCETTTHWQITEAHKKATGVADSMGVNMHLFAKADLVGVEMRFPDGKVWPGEGPYSYRKPSVMMGPQL